MYCVTSSVSIEDTIKKSRFIGKIFPCMKEIEALNYLKQLNSEHPNASHIVYAYRIQSENGMIMRFNDDGEPSGTAGKPVYQHIEGKNIINSLVVVIRYFGGIKLGAGGLTRAYGNTANKTIDASTLIEFIKYQNIKLEIEYSKMQNLQYQLNKLDGSIVNQEFSDIIKLLIKVPEQNMDKLTKLLN